ncbi:MAG: acylneuraminate cytidylyltransferase family protein [Erysipelotrichaceae bacterium]
MKNIAIILARSGSKGLPNKNIKKLDNKPLIAYTIEAAVKSNCFDVIMVSTDSSDYAIIAKQYGAEVPFLRSNENSNDDANSWDAVKEVLNFYACQNDQFETVALLQPTSPLRDYKDIINAYEIMKINDSDAVTSVCEEDHNPQWANTLPSDNSMTEFIHSSSNNARQNIPIYYRLNGAIYIRKIIYNDEIQIINNKHFAYIMSRYNSIDIDTQFDFDFADFLIYKKKVESNKHEEINYE